jgi:hypothetical protein
LEIFGETLMELFPTYDQVFVGVAIFSEPSAAAFRLHYLLEEEGVKGSHHERRSMSHSFRDLLEALVLVLLENVVLVEVQELEFPFDHLVIADGGSFRLHVLGVEGVDEARVESHSIVGRAFFARRAVARRR